MNIYEVAERYAKEFNMTVEDARVRVQNFDEIKKEMDKTRKCPECGKFTLEVEGGEWESGIPDWIRCDNEEVETIDEDGEKYFEYCEFTDDIEEKYQFAFHCDYDIVAGMATLVDIHDEEKVKDFIGTTWDEFVKKENNSLIEERKKIKNKFEIKK